MNKSSVVFSILSDLGVDYCASVSGGGVMYLVDAVCQNQSIKTRFFHHEQSAALAAEAYTRATAKPCVCLVTIGPGVANAVSGAFSAYINSVPIIFISGAKRSDIETDYAKVRFNYPQDVDSAGLVSSVVKKFYELSAKDNLENKLQEIWDVAISGRPGPVWISIPLDIQGLPVDSDPLPLKAICSQSVKIDILDDVKNFLEKSSKPVILIGRGAEGVMRSESYKKFLQNTELPFITSIGANHTISESMDRNLGFFGPTGRRSANIVLSQADAILAIGSGLDIDNTGFDRVGFFANKKVLILNNDCDLDISDCCSDVEKIQVDINKVDFDSLATGFRLEKYKKWVSFSKKLEKKFSVEWEISKNLSEVKVDPYLFMYELTKILPRSVGVAGGISLDVHAFSHVAKLKTGQEFYLSPHCGQLGWDLPALVGLADTDFYERVICITGDGSIMFNLQELSTLSALDIPMAIIVLDNRGYNSIRTSQDTHLGGRRYGSDYKSLAFPDWELLAKAHGFSFHRIKANQEINQLESYIVEDKSFIVVDVDPERGRTPRLVSKIVDGKFKSPTLFGQYPYLDEETETYLTSLISDLNDG